MYRFVIGELSNGVDFAGTEWAGRGFTERSRSGAAMGLARQLLKAGAPDGPVEAVGRSGESRWSCGSLHALARTVVGVQGGRLRLRPYRENHAADHRPDAPEGV